MAAKSTVFLRLGLVQTLLVLGPVMVIIGCDRHEPDSRSRDVQKAPDPPFPPPIIMPPGPPVPLEQVEAAILRECPLDIEQWRRTYSYRLVPGRGQFSREFITFSFDKGPYPDLRPAREWRDLREIITVDDRPGISIIFGNFDLRRKAVDIELGECHDRHRRAGDVRL